ncbi:MAG: BamA/TamA family outer membrane protein [Saprospiraceae bacterium]|nr:BamA/TamA family outer membrane protein [Saprospiraceae bacterium]
MWIWIRSPFWGMVIIALIISGSFCASVEAQSTERPKIGLALSGGGAKGFAHIGLLKVLEEVGIRPDYISGTSMGSIIGGLYAIGYSADQLAALSTDNDWEITFSNEVDLRLINSNEKANYGTHLVTVEYDDGKFGFGQGLINGQQLDLLLTRLSHPAYRFDHFDQFPIPFKCAAVDVLTGQIVVLEQGFLAEAQRASMAIPVVFAPVEMDGHLLVDGGVIRNFPVQEVIDMGADIVIGAYTGRGILELDEVNSLVDVLVQTNFLYGIKDSEEQAAKCDIFLDLSGEYGATDFEQAAEIIALGESRTRLHMDALEELADQLRSYGERNDLPALEYPDSLKIDEVSMTRVPVETRSLVRRFLDINKGDIYSTGAIEDKMNRLYGTQMFDRTSYALQKGKGSGTILQVQTEEKAALSLHFGLHYNNAEKAGIILKGRINNVLGKAAVLEGRLKIAETPAVHAALHQYIGPQRKFLYQVGFYFHRTEQFFRSPSQDFFKRFNADYFRGFGKLIWNFNNNIAAGISYHVNRIGVTSPLTQEDDLTSYSQENQAIGFEWNMNTKDRNHFATRGLQLDLDLGYYYDTRYEEEYGEDDAALMPEYLKNRSYSKISLQADWYLPIGPRLVLHPIASIGLRSQPGFADNFFMGGDYFYREMGMPFIGLREFRRSFPQIGMSQFGLRWMAFKKFYLEPKVGVARIQRADGANSLDASTTNIWGAGVTSSYDSFIGPMSLSIGSTSIQDGPRIGLDFGYRFVF